MLSHYISALLLFIVSLISPGLSQISLAQCTAANSQIAFNSFAQSPCVVAAYIGSQCDGRQFVINPIAPGEWYKAPGPHLVNECWCSGVMYSLISACALCQHGTFLPWSTWSQFCPVNSISMGSFPPGIPDGTAVPKWAFIDVRPNNGFNIAAAKAVGESPESIASTGSTAPPPGSTPAPSSGSGSSSTPPSSPTSPPAIATPPAAPSSTGSLQSSTTGASPSTGTATSGQASLGQSLTGRFAFTLVGFVLCLPSLLRIL